MSPYLIIAVFALLVINLVIGLVILLRSDRQGAAGLEQRMASIEKGQERAEHAVKEELGRARLEAAEVARQGREEGANGLRLFGDSLLARMAEIAGMQKNQLDSFSRQLATLTESNETRLERMRATVEERLRTLQDDNTQKLEQMRATVDEKLQSTLEKRLGESFKLVSERLEQVYRGLGEMQVLASNVGDLRKVLTNVKSRGTWGEIQLGALLEQILTREQYEANVATKSGSRERVEFAIRLPGRGDGEADSVWLPIDAKFPQEDYQRLIEAQEQANARAAEDAAKGLEARIKSSAKDIREKYLNPPETTDFGIMYLPTEGLYAEAIRRGGLTETLQREYRVVVAGPTTLAALLNSLQMGFRTLAIEKRSSEVWALLGAVKMEFGRFGDMLDKTQQKLREASNTIEDAARKTRTIERRLRKVQELPAAEGAAMLSDGDEGEGPIGGAPE
ncbi:MAG TPA: DNA recombination protein RmuC [Spirochaetota bacterium]|nr:DNA recombination protein RmuC [Spirochaetota bacterium]OPZ39465.1 MAG: DNA recombination protein RmuC [Spirochaetes bacterium ADurb.BinA120]HNU90467.1 DNA recombination protein RmuC [Spirochaetota bacterium]HPI13501.1 DNA recombination protein RmuC [Spirochaetota bacterium]HPV96539.1 DNA recombination protein RmuC [Spirochaetota bacterium]